MICLSIMSIYEIKDFLNKEECDLYLKEIEVKHHNESNFTDVGKMINKKWKSKELNEVFYDKLVKYISNENILRPNDVIMSGTYYPGNGFGMHTDTGLYYNRETKEKTRWTLLIYLNEDFNGGETVFYNEVWTVKKIVKPETGKAILFDIDLWHAGNEVLDGKKDWIGCEIIGKM